MSYHPYYDDAPSPWLAYNNDSNNTPLSPSSSTSSCSSDAPITPYYHAPPLPSTSLLYSGLDKYCQSPASAAEYAYDHMCEDQDLDQDPDATQTYHVGGAFHESEYDHAAALRACDDAIAQLDASTASPYASYDDAPLSPPSSSYSPHENEYEYEYEYPASSAYPAAPPPAAAAPAASTTLTCLSPSLLSCPPLLKLHQPQPRRSIPVISLAALASGDSDFTSSDASARSPALSPLELQMPFAPSSYNAYPSHSCTCPECTAAYPLL